MMKYCNRHHQHFELTGQRWRCRKCVSEGVAKSRRKQRNRLVEEAGGKCILCGYDRYVGALEFHHLDPALKEFGLSAGSKSVSFARKQVEACKCVLLCANCHAEIEGGVTNL